jgi:hypothetical protein
VPPSEVDSEESEVDFVLVDDLEVVYREEVPQVREVPAPLAVPECEWIWIVHSSAFDFSASGCYLLELAPVDWSGWEPRVYRQPVPMLQDGVIDEHSIVWETDEVLSFNEPGLPSPAMAAIDWGAPGLPYYDLGVVDWGASGVPM